MNKSFSGQTYIHACCVFKKPHLTRQVQFPFMVFSEHVALFGENQELKYAVLRRLEISQ